MRQDPVESVQYADAMDDRDSQRTLDLIEQLDLIETRKNASNRK